MPSLNSLQMRHPACDELRHFDWGRSLTQQPLLATRHSFCFGEICLGMHNLLTPVSSSLVEPEFILRRWRVSTDQAHALFENVTSVRCLTFTVGVAPTYGRASTMLFVISTPLSTCTVGWTPTPSHYSLPSQARHLTRRCTVASLGITHVRQIISL
jgi:hypothetical protein